MERRHFLTCTAAALAALAARDAWVVELLARPPAAAGGNVEPLTGPQTDLLAAICGALLPATDTPGATAAGVPAFIARLYADWMLADEQRSFRDGLADLDAGARMQHGAGFPALEPSSQLQLLEEWDAASVAARNGGQAPTFFARVKTLALLGYYTSEVGQERELHVRYGGGAGDPGGPNCTTIPMRI